MTTVNSEADDVFNNSRITVFKYSSVAMCIPVSHRVYMVHANGMMRKAVLCVCAKPSR